MNDNANSNIKQILNSFDNLVTILENPNWAKSVKTEEIKTAFKLGCFIEKTMAYFVSRNNSSEFINMLNKWWNTKTRSKVYSVFFFQFACDQLLIKFFKCENIAEATLDITIRVYTSIFPRARLQKVLNSLILLSSSYETITEFAKDNMTVIEAKEFEYHLKLTNWSNLLISGQQNYVSAEIENSLSLYKVESALYLLIGILSLNNISDSNEELVQSIILEKILQKMLDRSVLSKHFWLTLFKQIELDCICNACNNFKEFFISLFNFIIYIGSMMVKDDIIWKSDTTVSLCPEISYHDLLAFIRNISNSPTLKESVIEKLNEATQYTDSCIWDEIKQEL
ncbi:hypothetical protein NQ314_020384 [Rhamnusium bicolor]|uniref:Uncharacterized protein n=1 Tax=Rhamnusium bicolor TaxID=1586634 RepID=A0AAV8WLK6_9CUCU|nr:hypothetical protein NQ314_020384 [Rhamnusium bicolor]